jgi:hypothetical protein
MTETEKHIKRLVKKYAKDSFDKKLLKLELETLAVDAKREQIEELRKRK